MAVYRMREIFLQRMDPDIADLNIYEAIDMLLPFTDPNTEILHQANSRSYRGAYYQQCHLDFILDLSV